MANHVHEWNFFTFFFPGGVRSRSDDIYACEALASIEEKGFEVVQVFERGSSIKVLAKRKQVIQ